MALLPHSNITDRAWAIASDAHKEQVDKAGRPYNLHLLKVSKKMKTETEIAAAMLHDILEDTDMTPDHLIELHIPKYIVDVVRVLTHRHGEYYSDYIHRVSKNEIATKVKIADLEHNMDMTRLRNVLTKVDINRLQRYHQSWLWLKGLSDVR